MNTAADQCCAVTGSGGDDSSGAPWASFPIDFDLSPSTYTYPAKKVSVTTAADGTFSVVLTTDVIYEVSYPEVFIRRGASTQKPKGSTSTIVVPEGAGSITLETLQTVSNAPGPTPECTARGAGQSTRLKGTSPSARRPQGGGRCRSDS